MRIIFAPSWLLIVGLFTTAGCAGSAPGATMEQLQRRAWLDSGCRPDQLVLLHVDTRTKALEGCGGRLIYVESCEHIRGEHSCTWVLDNASAATGGWRASPDHGPQRSQGGYPARPGGAHPPTDEIPSPSMPSPLPSEYMPKHL